MAEPIYDTPQDWKTRESTDVNKVPPMEALLLEIYNQVQSISSGTVAGNEEIISSTNFVPVTTGAECTAALNFAIANLRAIGYRVTDFNTWSYYDTAAAATIFAWTIKYIGSATLANVITTFDITAGATASFDLVDSGTAIIDWGDGTIEEITTGTITHTYPGHTGVFEIRIFSDTLQSMVSFTAEQFGDFTIVSDTLETFNYGDATGVETISIDCPALTTFRLSNAGISTIDLSNCPALIVVFVLDCDNLPSIDFSVCPLATSTKCSASAILSSVDITGLTLVDTFEAASCTLPVSNVNAILVALDASGVLNGTCDLSGQTPAAAPTGAGATAKANLIANGWTVTTD